MYSTIIIGGGPAGLFCAANLTNGNNLLLEGGKKLGQKILITGGGMCNVTNMHNVDDFLVMFGSRDKQNFLKPALMNFNTESARNWLEENGLPLFIREDGKVFPESRRAQSVVDALYNKLTKNGCRVKYNNKVKSIVKKGDVFEIQTSDEIYKAERVVIATGGKSFPKTGSDGSGHDLAKSLGHKITKLTPALSNVKIENYKFKSISGFAIRNSNVDFFRPGETKRYLNGTGDLLFTHHGLSGPVIRNNSREVEDGDILYASLIPTENKELQREYLLKVLDKHKNSTVKRLLKEVGLTSSLTDIFLDITQIDGDLKVGNVGKKQRKQLINQILNFEFKVSSKLGFKGAMVTAGGVDLKEVDRKTMESRLVPGLYFAGEVLDIDGDTGGYNIQAAFSMSKLISESINGCKK